MSIFYFNVFDGQMGFDHVGSVLDAPRDARRDALRLAGDLIFSQGDRPSFPDEWTLQVTDDTGFTLYQIRVLLSEFTRTPPLPAQGDLAVHTRTEGSC